MERTRASPPHSRGRSKEVKGSLSATHATLEQSSGLQLELSIGRVPLRLHAFDEQVFLAARERYRAFEAAQEQPFAVHLLNSFRGKLKSANFAYDFEAQNAALRIFSEEAQFVGANNPYTLDSLLRIFLTWMLLFRTGFLLHAATVVRHGRAYLFTGQSGAGKSTVASLAPAGTVLTDELSLVRRENGVWRSYGTPFWGEFRAGDSNSGAPIRGIFRLVQAAENRVAPLRPVEFLCALMTNVLFFSRQSTDSRRLLEIAGLAAEELPGYTLEFRKDQTFWGVLP